MIKSRESDFDNPEDYIAELIKDTIGVVLVYTY